MDPEENVIISFIFMKEHCYLLSFYLEKVKTHIVITISADDIVIENTQREVHV